MSPTIGESETTVWFRCRLISYVWNSRSASRIFHSAVRLRLYLRIPTAGFRGAVIDSNALLPPQLHKELNYQGRKMGNAVKKKKYADQISSKAIMSGPHEGITVEIGRYPLLFMRICSPLVSEMSLPIDQSCVCIHSELRHAGCVALDSTCRRHPGLWGR